jgi:group II intron reverse transcriptase/maturase
VEVARKRCWEHDWVVDLDIQGFFDSIDHELLMRAIRCHTQEGWVLMYLERWLKAPVQLPDGTLQDRLMGTPQGGVISPLLANLFLHYAFDAWMRRTYPSIPFERYADDVVCHCRTQQEAETLKAALEARFGDCHLRLHPQKTQVVYCKDSNWQADYPQIQFTFLGFTFRPRMAKNRHGKLFTSFLPAVSPQALKRMRARIRCLRLRRQVQLSLEEIARRANPTLRGWWQYYGRFYPTELRSKLFRYFDERLGSWLRQKYKPLARRRGRSLHVLNRIAKERPYLFVHWQTLGKAMVG